MTATRPTLVLALTAVLLAACQTASPPPRAVAAPTSRELGRTSNVIVVAAQSGDTAASLAVRYLGDAALARRVVAMSPRGGGELRSGDVVAISRTPLDPGGLRSPVAQRVPILCYHRFTAQSRRRSAMEVSAADFEAQLRLLHDQGYTIIPLSQLGAFLEGRAELPDKPVALTIDDGYRSAYTVAWPLLRKYDAPATLFIYSGFVGAGEALSWPQLAELQASRLVDVQAHSKTHADLTRRRPGEGEGGLQRRLAAEFGESRDIIGVHIGVRPTMFAYPYGAANAAVVDYARRAGWSMALTVSRGGNPTWGDPLLLRRDMILGTDSLEMFARRLSAAQAPGRRP